MVRSMPNDPTDPDLMFDTHALSGGVHASDVRVWHTPHEFTLDFLSHWAHPIRGADSQLVAARVKIPPTAMFDIVRMLSNGVGDYEAEHGQLSPSPMEAS